jgi:hypothetical protein
VHGPVEILAGGFVDGRGDGEQELAVVQSPKFSVSEISTSG